MNGKLLPCPFCGGEAKAHEAKLWPYVGCTKCQASTSSQSSLAGAIKAWNTRAGQLFAYERTCHNADKTGIVGRFECSECGWIEADEPIYCGGCGAKVVKE